MLADFLGFAVPYETLESNSSINPEIYTTQSWRGVFIVPAGIAIVQTLIILVVFRHDTIKYYIQKGMKENVKRVESLIYKEEAIKPQIEAQHEENESPPNQINNSAENDVENQSNKVENADFNSELKEKVSIVQLFTARYRKAFIVGCLLAVFQQITGINAVIFYSNDIFTRGLSGYESEKSAKIGTMLVGVVNWAAAMSSIPLLTKFGRKTLLIFGQIGMGISLLLLAVFALIDQPIAIKILTLFFVAFFELSIGPILWLYAAEIMTESGMAAASLITWIITIIFGLFTSKFFDLLKPVGVYFTFTGIDILGLVFIIIVIKETKGKSKEELKSLYYTEKKTNSEDIQN